MTNISGPLILGPGQGRRLPIGQPTITVRTDAANSPGALFESEPPPGVLVAPPGVVHGFHNPGPGQATMLIVVYPVTGFGVVEEMYALLSAGAPDPAAVNALFAKYNAALIQS